MKESELRIASLFSGRASTTRKIVEESMDGSLAGKIKVAAVIADRSTAGIENVARAGLPCYVIDKTCFTSSDQWGDFIIKICREKNVDVILQNGWLSLTPENVIEAFSGHIFNQHPGDPLYFGGKGMYGLAVHASVLKFQELVGRRFPTEASIHRVTPKYDEGAVVYKTNVEVYPEDTPEVLAGRVLPEEHKAQVVFLHQLYDGKVKELKKGEELVRLGEEQFHREAVEYGVRYGKEHK